MYVGIRKYVSSEHYKGYNEASDMVESDLNVIEISTLENESPVNVKVAAKSTFDVSFSKLVV